MKTKIILLLAMFVVLSAIGQEDILNGTYPSWINSLPNPWLMTPSLKTNFFDGKIFRVVSGKTYNVIKSTDWQPVIGNVYQLENGVLILYARNYSGGDAPYTYTAIRNYNGSALKDQELLIFAMPVGTFNMVDVPIALYDCGTPYVAPTLTPEQIRAVQETASVATIREHQKELISQTNTVHWLLSQATNGDESAQCSLGEHYLNGQGCETNRELAIYWLTQAANHGDIEASNKLVSLQK